MPVAAELQPFLELVTASQLTPMADMTPAELRAQYDQLQQIQLREPPPLAGVADRTLPGPAGELPVRVYTPIGDGPFPVVAYFHGGGFVIGSLETHDGTCRELAARSGCVVVAVDYRLAPEHPYPAAPEDGAAVVRWLAERATEVGGDPDRLAVAGDSAGGNLAAVAALRARDDSGPRLALQVLVYPCLDASCADPSYLENADGYFLTAESMRWFWGHYLPEPALGRAPYACPVRSDDLAGVAPAVVVTAGYDPLRDEGERYAAMLAAAGVPVESTRYDDMVHGFYSFLGLTPRADEAHDQVAAALRRAFGLPARPGA